jgi:hypothetical protein
MEKKINFFFQNSSTPPADVLYNNIRTQLFETDTFFVDNAWRIDLRKKKKKVAQQILGFFFICRQHEGLSDVIYYIVGGLKNKKKRVDFFVCYFVKKIFL